MKINLPKSAKTRIKEERNKTFEMMRKEDIPSAEWETLNKRYQAYTEMLKPTWTVTPDTLLIALTNLTGILLILNFEKFDIIRTKAISFILKGRV